MMIKVQLIHAVLWMVRNVASGMKKTGIGPAMEMMAMSEIVKGNPSFEGHQFNEYRLKTLVIHMRAVRL